MSRGQDGVTLPVQMGRELRILSFTSTAAGLLGVAMLQFVAAVHSAVRSEATHTLSNGLGSAVCVIAGVHYTWIRTLALQQRSTLTVRYSDWYMTTSLMLVEFFNEAGALLDRWPWLVASCVACVLMLATGHASALARERGATMLFVLLSVSSLAFGALLAGLFLGGTVPVVPRDATWIYGFAAVWVLYPVAFFVESDALFALLDIVAKGGLGLVLAIVSVRG